MFVPIKNKKVYEHVIEQIQNMVMDGTLQKGDKLPSERDLVERLGVSRASIREALRALEIIGLIESRQGEGNFIRGDIGSSFFEPLSVMFMLNKGKPEELLELRMIIEVEAVDLAAKKVKKNDIEELKEIMKGLRNAKDEKESVKFDKQFHYKIAQITGNYLVVTLLNAIASLMEAFIENARGMILREEEKRELLIEQHQNICDALIEKNTEEAVRAMKEHLETINNTMKKLEI